MGQACTSDSTVSPDQPQQQHTITPLSTTQRWRTRATSSVSIASIPSENGTSSNSSRHAAAPGGGMGRSNSEPTSPQLVPIASYSVSALAEGCPESFEGPLTPIQPIRKDDIVNWLRESSDDDDSEECCGLSSGHPSSFFLSSAEDSTDEQSAVLDDDDTVRRFNALGGSYEHFEDNSSVLLAEAHREAALEKKDLEAERRKDAAARNTLRTDTSNHYSSGRTPSFFEQVSRVLTGSGNRR